MYLVINYNYTLENMHYEFMKVNFVKRVYFYLFYLLCIKIQV